MHLLLNQQMEEHDATRSENEILRQVIDLDSSIIFARDRDGRFTLVNHAAAQAFGRPASDMIGRAPAEIDGIAEGSSRIGDGDLDVIDAQREIIFPEMIFVDAGGHRRFLQMTKRPLHSSGATGFQVLNIGADVTERKIAEDSLRRGHEQILRHQAALHELTFTGESELQATLERITEISATTLPVSRASIWLFNEDRSRLVCEALHQAGEGRKEGGASIEVRQFPRYFAAITEGRVIAADDAHADPRTSEFSASTLSPLGVTSMLDAGVRAQGDVIGVVCNEHVGPVRSWGLEEQNFAASVADLVSVAVGAVRRRHLEDQLRQAQKIEAIGLLAGGIAHDFNNILTAILGYCQLMLMNMKPGDSMKGQTEEIRKAANRAASLVRQLLAFGRRQVLEPQVLELDQAVAGIRSMLERLIGEHIELSTLAAPRLGRVKVDPSQLEQVIMNLAVNSRDAMPDGGKLRIEMRNAVLDSSATAGLPNAAPGRYTMLTVSDTGCGMDAATCSRIFEPFFTTKAEGHGTGLGLSMVYGIIRQSGGHIQVFSEPGKGTRFVILLPQAPAEELPLPASQSAELAGGAREGEVVLVVEDESLVLKLACQILERRGYQTLSASSPAEALAICGKKEQRIDLLLTDMVMPQMTGREMCRRIRANRKGLRALFMSGYQYTEDESEGGVEPGSHFIQKPFTMDLLCRIVRQALDADQVLEGTGGNGVGS